MKIGIIDSGIDSNHSKLIDCEISGVCFFYEGEVIRSSEDFSDKIGHGTACASIIHKLMPRAELVAIKIFQNELVANEKLMHVAIEWCLKNEIRLINLSLGIQTSSPNEKLTEIVNLAYNKGVILVSAAHNNIQFECYPAFYPNVFGVYSAKTINKLQYGFIANSPIEFLAKGSIQRVAWKDNSYTIATGTSYACAHFTGIVAKKISEFKHLQISELKQALIDQSDSELKPIYAVNRRTKLIASSILPENTDILAKKIFIKEERNSWIKNIALFPISEKEINTLLEYPEYCKYSVAKKFDYARTLKVKGKDDVLYRLPKEGEYENFDTGVIGYFHDHLFEANVKYGFELLNILLEANKNLFVFDHRLYNIIRSNIKNKFSFYTGHLYIPEISKVMLEEVLHFRYLPNPKVPILAVIGTSNRQGKFTAQLRIKTILETEGYKVSFLSTEPHGELLGADFSFPYGFMSTVNIDRDNWSIFLRTMVKGLIHYNKPDILITGIQGGIVPRAYSSEPLGNETKSSDFLYGIQPDIVICAINPQDTLEQIRDAVNCAKIFTSAKNIFYFMTPWERKFVKRADGFLQGDHVFLSKSDYLSKLDYFSNELRSDVIDIKDKLKDTFILEKIQSALTNK